MSRLTARGALALSLVVLTGCATAGAATPGPSTPGRVPSSIAPTEGGIKVLTFNMCGEHCNADSTGTDIDSLLARIDAEQPNAVLLQEVCGNQFDALQSQSEIDGHWLLSGSNDTTEPRGCDGGKDSFGDAVLVHGSVNPATIEVKALKYPHGKGKGHQVRKTLCLQSDTAFPRATEVCTVHAGLDFEIGAKHQAAQIKQAYNFARGQAPTIPLIFGGDFNVEPDSNALDPIYSVGGGGAAGAMEEVDACPGKHGRSHQTKTCNVTTHDATPTVKHRSKNDYIFGSHKSFKELNGDVHKSSYSDHDVLVGSLYECSSGIC